MRYAIKMPEGKYINVVRPEVENHRPCFQVEEWFPLFYPSECSEAVIYLKGDLFMLADHYGTKGYEILKDVRLINDQGATLVLDWNSRKIGNIGVASVPVKEIIKRKLSDDLIPEIWKGHPQVFIDHFAHRIHPFDYGLWRYQDAGYNLSDCQSATLDWIDRAMRQYVSTQDKTLATLNRKIRDVVNMSEKHLVIETLELIRPLVIKAISDVLIEHDVTPVFDRYMMAKRKIGQVIDKTIIDFKPDHEFDAPF